MQLCPTSRVWSQTIATQSRLRGLFPAPFCAHSLFTQRGASFSALVHSILRPSFLHRHDYWGSWLFRLGFQPGQLAESMRSTCFGRNKKKCQALGPNSLVAPFELDFSVLDLPRVTPCRAQKLTSALLYTDPAGAGSKVCKNGLTSLHVLGDNPGSAKQIPG